MRTIKFRAWLLKQGIMCKVSTLSTNSIFISKWNCGKQSHRLEDIELMQFTGLLDKNKTEVYEGDYLKNDNGNIYEVFWNDLRLQWMMKGADGGIQDFSWWIDNNYHFLEVVGNKYENIDLMIQE